MPRVFKINVNGTDYDVTVQELSDVSSQLMPQYRDSFASPYEAASNFYITDVIEPCQTRATVSLSLRKLLSKRELRPNKKHGNMPL